MACPRTAMSMAIETQVTRALSVRLSGLARPARRANQKQPAHDDIRETRAVAEGHEYEVGKARSRSVHSRSTGWLSPGQAKEAQWTHGFAFC